MTGSQHFHERQGQWYNFVRLQIIFSVVGQGNAESYLERLETLVIFNAG